MIFPSTAVERKLKQTSWNWRWLRALQHTATLGAVLSVMGALLGYMIFYQWISSKNVFIAVIVALALAGCTAWIVILAMMLGSAPKRNWLAGKLEAAHPFLLDRLNTIVFLEKVKQTYLVQSYLRRIRAQATQVLISKPLSTPFSLRQPLVHIFICVLLITGTFHFYHHFQLWNRLHTVVSVTLLPNVPKEFALPDVNTTEQTKEWGEVRIVDPGHDLKVTKVDVVPLQIEASANRTLKKMAWVTDLNGEGDKIHALPAPTESRFAVYQPIIYLDEFHLSDWDVLTYHATVDTDQEDSYSSEIYFLEIRPFREDILKLLGGEKGKAYRILNELTDLIQHQQHIIRQTHQYIHTVPENEKMRAQDQEKLKWGEQDMRDSVNHFYAKVAMEMENQSVGEMLDYLAKAEKEIGQAVAHLSENSMTEAQKQEFSGLTDLINARKNFQKVVSEHPDKFGENDDEKTHSAEPEDKLKVIAEFRNESKAAKELLEKALVRQRELEDKSLKKLIHHYPQLGMEENEISKMLDDLKTQHPSTMNPLKKEFDDTQTALKNASTSLGKKKEYATDSVMNATQKLQALKEAFDQHSAGQELTAAYKVKRVLDQQIDQLEQIEQDPEGSNSQQVENTAVRSKKAINELKDIAENQPTKDAFGPQLREALSKEKQSELHTQLDKLSQSQGSSRKQAAGEAKKGMQLVSQAFEESQPQGFQMAQKSHSLNESDAESMERGLHQLESLMKLSESKQKIPPDLKKKQLEEILFNLNKGLMGQNNERSSRLLILIDQILKDPEKLEPLELKKLMEQLQNYSVELTEDRAKNQEDPQVNHIDTKNLPPAYRKRIEKYFQKLSEK